VKILSPHNMQATARRGIHESNPWSDLQNEQQ
jgi:hypothetical protein